ncbi:hypothetical protein OROHE_023401 [Orobanche hederae]
MSKWTCVVEGDASFGGMYKTSWPNVVGMSKEQATSIIVHDNPFVTVAPLPKGSVTIPEQCYNRVWLPIDELGRVYEVPEVG